MRRGREPSRSQRLMKTTAGVSWFRSRTVASSSVSAALVTTSSISIEAPSLSRVIARSIASGAATQTRTGIPRASRRSSENITLVGSETATSTYPSSMSLIGIAPYLRARLSGRSAAASTSMDAKSSSTNSRSCCSARTRVTCNRVAKPFVTRISPRRSSGLMRFSRRAISSCSGVTAPSRTRSVPRAGHGFLAASIPVVSAGSFPWLRDVARCQARIGETAQMRAVIQRVRSASVTVGGETVGAVGPGLLILLGIASRTKRGDAEALAVKVARLRIFENERRPVRPLDRRCRWGGAGREPVHALADDDPRKSPRFLDALPSPSVPVLCSSILCDARCARESRSRPVCSARG